MFLGDVSLLLMESFGLPTATGSAPAAELVGLGQHGRAALGSRIKSDAQAGESGGVLAYYLDPQGGHLRHELVLGHVSP